MSVAPRCKSRPTSVWLGKAADKGVALYQDGITGTEFAYMQNPVMFPDDIANHADRVYELSQMMQWAHTHTGKKCMNPHTRQDFELTELQPVRYAGFKNFNDTVARLSSLPAKSGRKWALAPEVGAPTVEEGAAMPNPLVTREEALHFAQKFEHAANIARMKEKAKRDMVESTKALKRQRTSLTTKIRKATQAYNEKIASLAIADAAERNHMDAREDMLAAMNRDEVLAAEAAIELAAGDANLADAAAAAVGFAAAGEEDLASDLADATDALADESQEMADAYGEYNNASDAAAEGGVATSDILLLTEYMESKSRGEKNVVYDGVELIREAAATLGGASNAKRIIYGVAASRSVILFRGREKSIGGSMRDYYIYKPANQNDELTNLFIDDFVSHGTHQIIGTDAMVTQFHLFCDRQHVSTEFFTIRRISKSLNRTRRLIKRRNGPDYVYIFHAGTPPSDRD